MSHFYSCKKYAYFLLYKYIIELVIKNGYQVMLE